MDPIFLVRRARVPYFCFLAPSHLVGGGGHDGAPRDTGTCREGGRWPSDGGSREHLLERLLLLLALAAQARADPIEFGRNCGVGGDESVSFCKRFFGLVVLVDCDVCEALPVERFRCAYDVKNARENGDQRVARGFNWKE